MSNVLLLASKSKSRQKLLKEAGINFQIIEQDAEESDIEWKMPLSTLLKDIALYKMKHVILLDGKINGEMCYVLTADTMGIDVNGNICGKPKNKQDAIEKIKLYRHGAQTGTGFCLESKVWENNKWITKEQVVDFVSADYIFDVPDSCIEKYFELSMAADINYLQVSGGVAIEEFGAQFLKSINGSYTTVVGLPMYEVSKILCKLGFFK